MGTQSPGALSYSQNSQPLHAFVPRAALPASDGEL